MTDIEAELSFQICGFHVHKPLMHLLHIQVTDGSWIKLSSSRVQIPQQKTWFSDVTGQKKIRMSAMTDEFLSDVIDLLMFT